MRRLRHLLPDRVALLLIAILLTAYALPWIVGAASALTFGAYDLAEWTSLNPTVREGNPPLVTTFWLRLPLACIGLLAAVQAWQARSAGWRLAFALIALLLIAAQLPPLEFLTSASGDPNYRQQFSLAAVTLVGGLAAARLSSRARNAAALGTAILGLLSSTAGMAGAYPLFADFQLRAGIGIGFAVEVIAFVAYTVALFRETGKQKE